MYFPYLRAKYYELRALAQCVTIGVPPNKLLPVLEPVDGKNLPTLAKTVRYCVSKRIPTIVIVNPSVGPLKDDHDHVKRFLANEQLISNGSAVAGLRVSQQTTLEEVKSFLGSFGYNSIAFIHTADVASPHDLVSVQKRRVNDYQLFDSAHTTSDYQNLFSGRRVLIQDGFKRLGNADYPPDEFFSDLHLRYRTAGFDGFGDFTIIGKKYSKGWIPHAFTIHLTYHRRNNAIWIKHFISNRKTGIEDTGGKFKEALVKLISFFDANPKLANCWACDELRRLHKKREFPGAGAVKELSIGHHLDLMTRVF